MSTIEDPKSEPVLQAVEAESVDHVRVVALPQEPLGTFGGKIAVELVVAGRTDPPWGPCYAGRSPRCTNADTGSAMD